MMRKLFGFMAMILILGLAHPGFTQVCEHRGNLDEQFCDNDRDLVADLLPAGQCKDPSTLVFTYTPVEDPAVYQDVFADFMS
jgi:phosphonate transport system substrate-binding protein